MQGLPPAGGVQPGAPDNSKINGQNTAEAEPQATHEMPCTNVMRLMETFWLLLATPRRPAARCAKVAITKKGPLKISLYCRTATQLAQGLAAACRGSVARSAGPPGRPAHNSIYCRISDNRFSDYGLDVVLVSQGTWLPPAGGARPAARSARPASRRVVRACASREGNVRERRCSVSV